jgi:hypothetical protein
MESSLKNCSHNRSRFPLHSSSRVKIRIAAQSLGGALAEDIDRGGRPVGAPVERIQFHMGVSETLGQAARQRRLARSRCAHDGDAVMAV